MSDRDIQRFGLKSQSAHAAIASSVPATSQTAAMVMLSHLAALKEECERRGWVEDDLGCAVHRFIRDVDEALKG